MKIKLDLDEKKIALIRNMTFQINPQTGSFECNKSNPYGVGRLYDDIALILGYYKDYIPNIIEEAEIIEGEANAKDA